MTTTEQPAAIDMEADELFKAVNEVGAALNIALVGRDGGPARPVPGTSA